MQRGNPFADLIGTGSAQGQVPQGGGGYEQLFAQYRKQPTMPKPKKKKDFWTDQLSTGGGIGGALGGAAAGAAIGSVVPVVGTAIGGLVGGIAGGALGAGAGELGENFATEEEDKFKNVGTEALLGGIFAAPPLRLARGVSAASKAGLAGKGAKAAFDTAFIGGTKAATRSGTERAAHSAIGEAWGIRPGVKSTGTIITPQRAKELQNFSKTVIGVPKTSSADMVFERAVNHQTQVGSSISDAIKALPEGSIDIQGLNKSVSNRFGKLLGVDPSKNQVAKDILGQLQAAKTPQQLWELRKSIDNELINFSRNPASTIPGAEQAARAARTEISNALSKAAPGLKDLNKQYSNVVDIINLTADAARTPKGFKIPGFQQTVGGATAQRVKAGAGNTLEAARTLPGKLSTGSTEGVGGLLGLGARQAVGQNAFGQEPQGMSLDEALLQQSQGLDGLGEEVVTDTTMQAVEQSPYSRENLMADIQRDPENAEQYMAYYSQLQEVYAQPDPASEFSQSSKNAMASSDNAINTIDQLEGLYQNAGGGSGRIGGAIQGLMGGAGFDENARVYDNLSQASVTQIAKALAGSGAGTVSDMDAKVIIAALPTLQDTPREARIKFAALRQRLEEARNNTLMYGGGGGGTLEDALLAQQGGAY